MKECKETIRKKRKKERKLQKLALKLEEKCDKFKKDKKELEEHFPDGDSDDDEASLVDKILKMKDEKEDLQVKFSIQYEQIQEKNKDLHNM